MSEVPVQKVTKADERALPIFQEIEAVLDRIRERAFNFAARRGFHGGHDLDDWLAAERKISKKLPVEDVDLTQPKGGFSLLDGAIAWVLSGKTLLSERLTLDGLVSVWHPQ